MKSIICFICILIFCSCNSLENDYDKIVLQEAELLKDGNILFEYDADYPVGIYKENDSAFFVIQALSDTCFQVYNPIAKRCLYVGKKGYGSEEFLDPNIISSVDKSKLLLEDSDLKKIVRVDVSDDIVNVTSDIPYPEAIFIAKELNTSPNYFVGRKVGPYEKMFFIYDKRSQEIIEIDNYPKTPYHFIDNNYTFAPVLSLNEQKDRIILGMYFWDIIQIYNLKGEFVGGYKFQDEYMPNYDKHNKRVDLNRDYSGVIRSFSTADFCYLLRRNIKDTQSQYSLIQLDWDGKLIHYYDLPNNVLGDFYVDESVKQLYIIQRTMNERDEEIYSIVSYGLH